LLELRLTTSQ